MQVKPAYPSSSVADSLMSTNRSCLRAAKSSGISNLFAATNLGSCMAVSVGSSNVVSVGLALR